MFNTEWANLRKGLLANPDYCRATNKSNNIPLNGKVKELFLENESSQKHCTSLITLWKGLSESDRKTVSDDWLNDLLVVSNCVRRENVTCKGMSFMIAQLVNSRAPLAEKVHSLLRKKENRS